MKKIKINTQKNVLREKFMAQLIKFAKYPDINNDVLMVAFENIVDKILSFGFSEIKVSLSSNPGISFKLTGKEKFRLNFELFINEGSDNEVAYSLYEDDDLIDLDSGFVAESTKYILDLLNKLNGK